MGEDTKRTEEAQLVVFLVRRIVFISLIILIKSIINLLQCNSNARECKMFKFDHLFLSFENNLKGHLSFYQKK